VYKYTNTLLRTHPSLLTHAAGPAPFIVQIRCPPSFVCLPLPLLEWNMHVLVAFLHTPDACIYPDGSRCCVSGLTYNQASFDSIVPCRLSIIPTPHGSASPK
jgi:hypothetical protein